MSKNELKTFNIDMKLNGYVTIQLQGTSENSVKDYLETFDSSKLFKFQTSEFYIEDSCVEYFHISDVQEVS